MAQASTLHEQVQAERARRSLPYFVRKSWPYVEPGQELMWNWHIDAICEHLEAVTAGQIRNLLINVPPRFMKSTLVNIMWPAWVWASDPGFKFIFSSYSLDLVLRDARKCRQLLESSWYQRGFSDAIQIARGNNALHRFGNTRGGERFAASVNSSIIGEGADGLVCDDAHNIKDVESDVVREGVLTWWDQAMFTRQNDPKTVVRLIIMQRVHVKDLAGHAIELGYEHLNLPMEFESKRKCVTSIGWEDPRKVDGELLWPERFGPEEVAALKTNLGPLGYASQAQQAPVPSGGLIFKDEWMSRRYVQLPDLLWKIQTVDSAWKEGVGNDWTVIATWATDGINLYVLDVWRERKDYPDVLQAIKDQYAKWRPDEVLIEDEASGKAAIQTLERTTAIPVVAVDAIGSKISRAQAATPFFAALKVWLPEQAAWVATWIQEHVRFPRESHDDQVDTTAMAVNRLKEWLQDALVPVVASRTGLSDRERLMANRREAREQGEEPEDPAADEEAEQQESLSRADLERIERTRDAIRNLGIHF